MSFLKIIATVFTTDIKLRHIRIMLNRLLTFFSQLLLKYLEKPVIGYQTFSVINVAKLRATLKPGDVILVDGNLRISRIIKFLTQSSWSHAAIYIGSEAGLIDKNGQACELVEADAKLGVIGVSLDKYSDFNTRICRPVNLTPKDRNALVTKITNHIGDQYDLKNVFDLMRYLLPYPPVPTYVRRRMIALGSGDPTRAICSTLIANAFQSIKYPILPEITHANAKEIYHIRHHSLYTPRDFDLSPFFKVIKPTLSDGFNHRNIKWDMSTK